MTTLATWLTALFGSMTATVATMTLVAAVAVGVTAELVVTDSLAVFTDQEVNAANTFAAAPFGRGRESSTWPLARP